MNANLPNDDVSRPTIYRPPDVQIDYSPTEETFQRILDNDPGVAGVRFACRENISELAGRAFSQSIHLRWLELSYSTLFNSPELMSALFMRLAENRSIEHLGITDATFAHLVPSVDFFEILTPFFIINHNLRCVEIHHSQVSDFIPSFTSALQSSRELRLERIDLSHCVVGDERIGELIDAFTNSSGLSHLLELCLVSNLVGQLGCTAIGKLLKKSECSVRTLELNNNVLDDECINILVDALIVNSTLRKLGTQNQKFVTPTGWCVFSAYLSHPNCSFDKVCFREDHLDDSVFTSLGITLAINKTVTHLTVSHSQQLVATALGWRGFSTCLRCPGSVLQVLDLNGCDVDDDGAVVLAAALAENTSVKGLSMSGNLSITSSGWVVCLKLMLKSPTLKEIDLSSTNIDDAGVVLMARLLGKMSTMLDLDLRESNNVTIDGWRAIADVLPSSTLRSLYLGCEEDDDETIFDDLIISYANALTCNTSLLSIGLEFSFSEVGYSSLVNALCDISSIENTFASNHTLMECEHNDTASNGIVDELYELTQINCGPNKSVVARKKILMHYFTDERRCVHTFCSMKIAGATNSIILDW